MAAIVPGSIVADIRGSVGTETYSRNLGGLYVKQRFTPFNPQSAEQTAVRDTLTALSQAWSGLITADQRAQWRSYARQHPLPNTWGVPKAGGGYTAFVRANFHTYRVNTAVRFGNAPVEANLHPPIFTFTAVEIGDVTTIALPPGNYDPPTNALILYAFIGQPVTAGRNYYSTPFRFVGWNLYNGAWTNDPWTPAYPFDLSTGAKVFMRMVAQDNTTGELSTSYQTSATII